jgi:hypothetical protein
MKKYITIFLSLLFISSANADIGIGVSGAIHSMDVSGKETLRQSSKTSTASKSNDASVPEIFVEAFNDSGFAFGLSYIPVRELGKKTRSDANTGGDTGDYTANAELDNVISIYADIPLVSVMSAKAYAKVGVQHVTIKTLEALNSGTVYADQSVLGTTIGLGVKGDLPFANMYAKFEGTYTDFEDYTSTDTVSNNKIEADLDETAIRLSLGYKF